MKMAVQPVDHKHACDALIVPLFENEGVPVFVKPFDSQVSGQLANAFKEEEFTGKKGQVIVLRCDAAWKRLLAIGMGKKKELSSDRVRETAGIATLHLSRLKRKHVAWLLHPALANHAQAVAEGVELASYRFDKYRTSQEEKEGQLERVDVLVEKRDIARTDKAVRFGGALARVQNETRAVLNEPANQMTPMNVADIAGKMAKSHGLKCTVYGKSELQKMRMNALLSVSQGSVQPPVLVVLEHAGAGKPVIFVGKGITFDSGGISLKPSKDMDQMKFDKAGAIAVLGVLQASAELKIKQRVIGILALSENLPSGSASKPGDIITARNGKTIEILNTDAEGRLALADALAFASEMNPKAIVDLATLTGACVVALGDLAAGLMGTDDPLLTKLESAGRVSGERVWRLPLWPEYLEHVKSDVADVKNVGANGAAGTIAGASFLHAFVKEGIPWAHLDIAGVAWTTRDKPGLAKGGTGFGVRLLVELLRSG
ncbi:leucyl aminopeptidase [Candidatus Micrarchaeota archaeon]|nr:leucyl aminopeptidase [Candidatus Micrarchaeota archaeon]